MRITLLEVLKQEDEVLNIKLAKALEDPTLVSKREKEIRAINAALSSVKDKMDDLRQAPRLDRHRFNFNANNNQITPLLTDTEIKEFKRIVKSYDVDACDCNHARLLIITASRELGFDKMQRTNSNWCF